MCLVDLATGDTIATYQRRIAVVPTHESELTELMRDYDTLEKTYTSLLTRKEDSKISADLERRQIGEQFKILDPAREPEKPVSHLSFWFCGCLLDRNFPQQLEVAEHLAGAQHHGSQWIVGD